MTLAAGIYGLFRLDGGPVDPADAAAMGLAFEGEGPAFATGIDTIAPHAVHRDEAEGAFTILVGELDEAEALADSMGLARDTPHARLAAAGLERFGERLPALMFGEWTLLHRTASGRLTLMSSAAKRDRIFYCISGMHCAVAPDLFRLARIPWVGDRIDPSGILYRLARQDVRSRIGDRTMLAGVKLVEAGGCLTIDGTGVRSAVADVFAPQPRWTGSFDEALEEAEALLRRIARQRMARNRKVAILLSGGLDSSLVAWLAAAEQGESGQLAFITTVAPAGSDLADEHGFADIVAGTFGMSTIPVVAPEEANIYRPPDHILAGFSGPLMSNRQSALQAMHEAAHAEGVSLLMNGGYGEMTMTASLPSPLPVRGPLRRMLAPLRRQRRARPMAFAGADAFHLPLAPGLLANLPADLRADVAVPPPDPMDDWPAEQWGYTPGIEKALVQPNIFYPGALRMDYPFRDLRLLRLFARFPTAFMEQGGLDRAPARHMLKGRLPDSIRLRTGNGLPASPDHMMRLQRQAPAARARIAEFRRAEVQEWLDLDWLDRMLGLIAARGPVDYAEANAAQLGVLFGEFMLWWRTRR